MFRRLKVNYKRFFKAWSVSLPVALVATTIVAPIVEKFVDKMKIHLGEGLRLWTDLCFQTRTVYIFYLSLSSWKGNINLPVQMVSTQQQQWFGFCRPRHPVIHVIK